MELDSNYFLLLVDIKNSSELPNRKMDKKFQELEKTLTELNDRYKNDLELPLSVSYGDEIAGLFKHPENIYPTVATIRSVLYPLTGIRFVVAEGKISRVSEDIRKIGGKIFKVANKTMEELKDKNLFCSWKLNNDLNNKILNSLCELTNVLIENMSDYQRNVYELLKQGKSQKEIAELLNKYAQSVWNAIQTGKATYILQAEEAIQDINEI